MRFKNFLGGLLVALASVVSFGAHAEQTQWKSLAPDLRAVPYFIPNLIVKTATVVRAAGLDTHAISANLSNGSVSYAHVSVATSSIAPFPYPMRFNIRATDLGAATTAALSCSSVTVRGNGPNGLANPPEIFAVTETAQLSAYAYEQVTSVEATGCSGGGDTSDDLVIYGSTWVWPGAPMRVNSGSTLTNASSGSYFGSANLVSVCAKFVTGATQGAHWYCVPGNLFEFSSTSNTVNLATTFTGSSPGWPLGQTSGPIGLDGSPHLLRVRASLW